LLADSAAAAGDLQVLCRALYRTSEIEGDEKETAEHAWRLGQPPAAAPACTTAEHHVGLARDRPRSARSRSSPETWEAFQEFLAASAPDGDSTSIADALSRVSNVY